MTEQEYFTVHHRMTANVERLGNDFTFPSFDEFEAEIPTPFLVASEFSQLDNLNDSARLELKNSDFKHVIQLLDNQNSKLNLLLTFMLSQQDDAQHRHNTTSFGASQFSYQASQAVNIDTKARVKLFIEHPPSAIYCYAQVNNCEKQAATETKDEHFIVTLRYELLRDSDQDLLIKAALYQQQKLLRQRSLNRDK